MCFVENMQNFFLEFFFVPVVIKVYISSFLRESLHLELIFSLA